MCGIAGFAGQNFPVEQAESFLRGMVKSLYHRGPDSNGIWSDGYAGLSNTRLAIVDVAAGAQPMHDEHGQYVIVFNGEIFNHVDLRDRLIECGLSFRTRSDTEVLLKALMHWGEAALDRLEGQFAFAFYDRRARRILFGRDRMGERPLHFVQAAGGIAFASEIKALFALPFVQRRLSALALRRLAQFWSSLPGETCFEGVTSLPPGYLAVYEEGQLSLRPYWRLPVGTIRLTHMEDAVEEVRETIRSAVRLRLESSDVEVGAYVSGGIDSSIVSALAVRENNAPLRGFSIAFDDPAFDEHAYQQQVAAELGIALTSVRISDHDIVDNFAMMIRHAETAQFRTAPIPMLLLSRQVHAEGVKVVLTGEGSDEVFLGYDLFKEALFRRDWPGETDAERAAHLARVYPYLDHFQSDQARSLLSFFARSREELTPGLFSHETRFTVGLAATNMLVSAPGSPAEDAAALAAMIEQKYPGFTTMPLLDRARILEAETLLAGYLLSSQGDRMAAANSVETRSPFLDSRVVSLGFALQTDLMLDQNMVEKKVLREAFSDVLSGGLIGRRKIPYRAPDAMALLSPVGKEWMRSILTSDAIAATGVLDPVAVGRMVQKIDRSHADSVSPRDIQTLVFVLSIVHLQQQLVAA